MRVRTKVWLETDGGEVLFGAGRLKILRSVQSAGSLTAAARALGMSYRALWGKIRATEKRLGTTLVTEADRHARRTGACLTPEAAVLMERFERFLEQADHAVKAAASSTLGREFR